MHSSGQFEVEDNRRRPTHQTNLSGPNRSSSFDYQRQVKVACDQVMFQYLPHIAHSYNIYMNFELLRYSLTTVTCVHVMHSKRKAESSLQRDRNGFQEARDSSHFTGHENPMFAGTCMQA